jgi:hypothetical protein
MDSATRDPTERKEAVGCFSLLPLLTILPGFFYASAPSRNRLTGCSDVPICSRFADRCEVGWGAFVSGR